MFRVESAPLGVLATEIVPTKGIRGIINALLGLIFTIHIFIIAFSVNVGISVLGSWIGVPVFADLKGLLSRKTLSPISSVIRTVSM
jgi:hypothetical protein